MQSVRENLWDSTFPRNCYSARSVNKGMQNKCDWLNWWDICRNVRYKIEIKIEIKIKIKNEIFFASCTKLNKNMKWARYKAL
jgi:hypothetical protein